MNEGEGETKESYEELEEDMCLLRERSKSYDWRFLEKPQSELFI